MSYVRFTFYLALAVVILTAFYGFLIPFLLSADSEGLVILGGLLVILSVVAVIAVAVYCVHGLAKHFTDD